MLLKHLRLDPANCLGLRKTSRVREECKKILKNHKKEEDLLFLLCFVLGSTELYKTSLNVLCFIDIYDSKQRARCKLGIFWAKFIRKKF